MANDISIEERALREAIAGTRQFVRDNRSAFQQVYETLKLPEIEVNSEAETKRQRPNFITKEGDFSAMVQALTHHVQGTASLLGMGFDTIDVLKENNPIDSAMIKKSEGHLAGNISYVMKNRDYLQGLVRVLRDPEYQSIGNAAPAIPILEGGIAQLDKLQTALEAWAVSKGYDVEALKAAREKV